MTRTPAPRRRVNIRSAAVSAAALIALGTSLTACSSDAGEAVDSAGTSTGPTATGYPVTVSNCGHEVTLDAAPQRIVTIKSTSTELVLALGLQDKVVGHAFPDGPVPDEYADAATGLDLLSEKAPSQEVVLEAEPDLVFAGWESNLAADTAGERDVLDKLGVSSYVSPAACQSAEAPEKMTFDLLFDQIAEAGRLLGAPERATELVTEQKAQLAGLGRVAEGTTALWWSSGVDTPFVGGGAGSPQMVMDAIGLTNVVADIDETWTSLGWEAVVEADPDVIVLVDAEWNTADSKIEQLEANPATAAMQAVKKSRYLKIPFPAGEAGVRSVSAAADLLAEVSAFGLGEEDEQS
jgi:iron complex transport system substrate-binding protein